MKITLNGETRDVTGPTVHEVLAEIGLGEARVATALNGSFLPSGLRDRVMQDGDALEVVAPMQGG